MPSMKNATYLDGEGLTRLTSRLTTSTTSAVNCCLRLRKLTGAFPLSMVQLPTCRVAVPLAINWPGSGLLQGDVEAAKEFISEVDDDLWPIGRCFYTAHFMQLDQRC